MYTSVMLLALSGLTGVADEPTPAWQNDYYTAQKQGETQSKPLAVFLAPEENGYNKVSREGTLTRQVKQLLSESYIPVHVNTSTDEGKQLARAFEMTGDMGLVISDKTGAVQAFWYRGNLPNQELVRRLQRYSDPRLIVRITETGTGGRMSFYEPPGTTPTPADPVATEGRPVRRMMLRGNQSDTTTTPEMRSGRRFMPERFAQRRRLIMR